MSQIKNISVLGVGLMGFPMAERLLEKCYQVTVFNRTQAKADPLSDLGAHVVSSVGKALSASDCIILMLADASAIQELLFSDPLPNLSGKTIIQMGTISSLQSIETQKKIFECGGEYFECPVLGSRKEASTGQLLLMVGSTEDKFNHWKSFLEIFGPNPYYVGGVGKAASLKLALNHLIAAHAVGFSQSLGIVQKADVDPEIFMSIVRKSALYAPMFDKKLNNWLSRSYDNPNFPVKHMAKDVGLVLEEAQMKGLNIEGLQMMLSFFEKSKDMGLADQDYSAVYEYFQKPPSQDEV